jgi:hypothetical protein
VASQIIVTGYRQIDRRLLNFPPKVQRKLVRKGMRKAAKKVQDKFKTEVAQAGLIDTGAYQQSTSVRAMKRSRVRVGVRVFIDRARLVKVRQRRLKVVGKRALKALLKATDGADSERQTAISAMDIENKQKAAENTGFYPAVYEFGTAKRAADRPLRKGLYDNASVIRQTFVDAMREVIREA